MEPKKNFLNSKNPWIKFSLSEWPKVKIEVLKDKRTPKGLSLEKKTTKGDNICRLCNDAKNVYGTNIYIDFYKNEHTDNITHMTPDVIDRYDRIYHIFMTIRKANGEKIRYIPAKLCPQCDNSCLNFTTYLSSIEDRSRIFVEEKTQSPISSFEFMRNKLLFI